MQQSSATPFLHLGFWDCCMLSILLAVPSCIYSFWHSVISTSYLIFTLVDVNLPWPQTCLLPLYLHWIVYFQISQLDLRCMISTDSNGTEREAVSVCIQSYDGIFRPNITLDYLIVSPREI